MQDTGIYAREFEALGRTVQIGVASGRVINVDFPESIPDDAETDHPLLDRVADYLDGAPDHFDDVPLALTMATDQREVLEAVRNVPYGETITVSRLTTLAGLDADDEDDRLLVERALRANPAPLFVPDHRIDGPGAAPPAVAEALRRLEA
ncbi:MGMT family protein [Halobium salinum]|uniref:MGMT family protein n=1 Tax=Halobium salinum TaxID=1364940 RepID=A0ABD5PHI4_9EURY|nr:MGMT family protein [Halobium salinum]